MTANTLPFKKAEPIEQRLKLFLWGDSGTGKTTFALQFPKPFMIDLEAGSNWYAGKYDFGIPSEPVTTADELMRIVGILMTQKHEYKTIIIDPITVYYDMLQAKWGEILMRKRSERSAGHKGEFYEFQPGDWKLIKAEHKTLIRRLYMTDMNVIATAHEKAEYADTTTGELMKKIGVTFDGEKKLHYSFDTVVHTFRDKSGRFMGENKKNRTTFQLPTGTFPLEYKIFSDAVSTLNKETKTVTLATEQQRNYITELIIQLGISEETQKKGFEKYEVTGVDDENLTSDDADKIIAGLKGSLAKTKPAPQPATDNDMPLPPDPETMDKDIKYASELQIKRLGEYANNENLPHNLRVKCDVAFNSDEKPTAGFAGALLGECKKYLGSKTDGHLERLIEKAVSLEAEFFDLETDDGKTKRDAARQMYCKQTDLSLVDGITLQEYIDRMGKVRKREKANEI